MMSETSENAIFVRFYFTLCYLMATFVAGGFRLNATAAGKVDRGTLCLGPVSRGLALKPTTPPAGDATSSKKRKVIKAPISQSQQTTTTLR